MHLADILRICLLAAASRYPGCLVEINEAVLDQAGLWEGDCTAEEALQRLESQRPQLYKHQRASRSMIEVSSICWTAPRSSLPSTSTVVGIRQRLAQKWPFDIMNRYRT